MLDASMVLLFLGWPFGRFGDYSPSVSTSLDFKEFLIRDLLLAVQ
jgi:hypothetical protein